MSILRYKHLKHLRLDQGKIERAKRILKAKTETETMDKALEKIIQEEKERLRRRNLNETHYPSPKESWQAKRRLLRMDKTGKKRKVLIRMIAVLDATVALKWQWVKWIGYYRSP